MVSASLRNLLGSLVRVQAPRDGRAGLVFATPPGERHELGITAAAMLAAAGGLGVVYLGSDLPTADVVEAARRTGARAVVLAMTRLELGPSAVEAVRTVVDGVPAGVEVFVGRGPFADLRQACSAVQLGRIAPPRFPFEGRVGQVTVQKQAL